MAKQVENIALSVQKHAKGISTDMHPVDQPQGTYRYALNAVAETREGEFMNIATEESNEVYYTFEIPSVRKRTNVKVISIGSVYIDDNEHLLFGTTMEEDHAVIGILNDKGELNILIDDEGNSCLNFRMSHQIQGTYRATWP